MLLSGCEQESSIPTMPRAAILAGAESMLAGCTANLDGNGDIAEAGLVAAGWKPVRRTMSAVVEKDNSVGLKDEVRSPDTPSTLKSTRDHEATTWTHGGWIAELFVSRNGGAFSERMPGECSISFHGKEKDTAESVRGLLAGKYGRPVRIGTRSRGGDYLTPRWFGREIHAQYWALPHHDVYWVSSAPRFARIEVVAMPDRSQLSRWSDAQPGFRVHIPEAAD